ncbi:hypothetical protein [Glaciecola petra]|uniref:Lipoprotein n=1 Tax=Glaciecola petra TaxID=3075602 RepID=A0ABU2ZM98_9ALTE|nr:hypothetical protein [Aestuariibacter sp. P117]MDT0593747.1 hypothetical protein [Aestuariibacter sp. P117]
MSLFKHHCQYIFALSFIFLQGCSSVPKALDDRAQIDLKNTPLMIEAVNEVGRYTVKNNESMNHFMGVLTPLYLVGDRYVKTNKVMALINSSADDFSERLGKRVARALTEQGYKVQQLAHNNRSAPSNVSLTLTLVSMGFSDDDHAGKYVPFMYVQARITDISKRQIYYDQRFAIGNKSEAGQSSIYIPNSVAFNGFDNLIKNPEKASHSFDALVEKMANTIALHIATD